MANQEAPSFPTEFSSAPHCSICLDPVVDNIGRSIAKLHCHHFFHLDCIGSEFNAKGAMQCPNCRETEEGQWLFAAGLEPSENNEETDDDVAPLSASAPIGYHVCAYSGITQSSLTIRETRTIPNGRPNNALDVSHHMSTRMPNIHLHQHSWITQGPFPYRGGAVNSSNQGVGAPILIGSSFQRVIFNRSGGHQGGSVVNSVGSSYQGNNDSRQVRNRASHQQPSHNSSPPMALAIPAPRRHHNIPAVTNYVRDRPSSSYLASNHGENDSLTELTLYTEPQPEVIRESNYTTE